MIDKTSNIHLMVTDKCYRKCKYCCNKQYDINSIPYATDDELKHAKNIYITGGEPFIFSSPSLIARDLKWNYSNIKNVIVYTNAFELSLYLKYVDKPFEYIDGLDISIKNFKDKVYFRHELRENSAIQNLSHNRIYVFDNLITDFDTRGTNFEYIEREWQKNFTPADDSIFRRYKDAFKIPCLAGFLQVIGSVRNE